MEDEISSILIARYYLTSELGKRFHEDVSKSELKKFIEKLDSIETLRLLELVSEDYRKNGIYKMLSNSKLKWYKKTIEIKDIKLSEVNDTIKPYLQAANYDPLMFNTILKQNKDNKHLYEFHPREIHVGEDVFIFVLENGKFNIIDGMHRLMSMVQNGITEIKCFYTLIN